MTWKPTQIIAIVSVLFIASCSKPESESTSEPQPADEATPVAQAGGSDPTIVDPDHYETEFENEAVRNVRIAYGAGEESVMHYHPDSVAVFLTDHLVEMTMPGGSTEEISAKAGDAIFIPGGRHLPKNISDSAWKLVLIELKQ